MELPIASDLDDPGPGSLSGGQTRTVKSHLLASRELLVAALYNLAPLLDRVLAAGLLSQENYFEVGAERTPQGRARRLLEVVQAEMDEVGARQFVECLRSCRQHYPRLREWLSPDANIERGPTERQLQAQLSVLCSRLGYSVLPVALSLFSNGTLTQFELDQVQTAPTSYQQTHLLLTACLAKGERACCRFYQALGSEDPQLASDISGETSNAGGLEEAQHVSVVTGHISSVAVEDHGVCSTPVEAVDQGVCNAPVQVRDQSDCSIPIGVEEIGSFPENHSPSGVLWQVLSQLSVVPGEDARLNVCELGVAVGLPRRTIRECLLEEVEVGDAAQLKALVDLFLSKTGDTTRLLARMSESTAQRVLLSERGCMLLKLLLEAKAFLHSGDHRHLGAEEHVDKVWIIFSFVMWDITAEVLEEPTVEPWEPKAGVSLLRGSERVETELLQELEECWAEGGTENLLQSIRVLAQVLRDLHPLQDRVCLSPPEGSVYSCRPHRLHRVTRFQGLPARTIRKALGHGAPSASAPLPSQYRDLCFCIARLLNRVSPEEGAATTDLSQAPSAAITQHIRSALARSAFGSQSFDAGVRHRVLSVVKYNPVQWGLSNLQELHRDTLLGLESYLKPGEHHSFQLLLERVQVLGGSVIHWAGRVRGPVNIDHGVEEVLGFVTSKPASFLVSVSCRGYERGGFFWVREPRCVCLSGLGEGGVPGLGDTPGVLAVEGETVWVREGSQVRERGTELSATLLEMGCCFRVNTSGTFCQVKFIYKTGNISAVAEKNCEVV
ncbi:uncharacterized protein LOC105021966 isoform X2 [Esox lucius]|uniref:uncharacterized protein LOC105021966 isoform X2 n=1 Tax=Esox lucius TaxID=8010 RepID=UPI001476ACF8|nr:uncharacterized protein LOC105021966 isoform X2 [Esox lucius]